MTDTSGTRRTSAVSRLAALLILIGIGGCDNVEWGGLDLAVVPPPPQASEPAPEVTDTDRLPEGPVLYYVRRDSVSAEVVPVGEITDDGMVPIAGGDDPETFGNRFIGAFLREGAEFTLFNRSRRAGTLIVDSAQVPETGVCRSVPRATGHLELSGSAGQATEFLAMARTQAPEGRVLPGDEVEPSRRMQVLGPILAERALRQRRAQLPNWSTARRQVFPFPVSETRDPAFTSTFLVDDELRVGNDDVGYSLFIVYTPQAQSGYDTAYVAHTNYPTEGKSAPRVIDFLDWDRDGSPELLMQVYGTDQAWFEAVGATDGEWSRILQDRCDPGATVVDAPPDTADDTDTADDADAEGGEPAGTPTPAGPPAQSPAQAAPQQPADTTPPLEAAALTAPNLEDLEPVIRLSVPGVRPRAARSDTSDGART